MELLPVPAEIWRTGRALHNVHLALVPAWVAAAIALFTGGNGEAAVLALLAGVAANGILALLWDQLPHVLGQPVRSSLCAWTATAGWQMGVALLALALAGPPGSNAMGLAGGFLLLSASILLLQELGGATLRSHTRKLRRFRLAAPFLAAAIIPLPTSLILLTLSFLPGAFPGERALALVVLAFGFLLPTAIAMWILEVTRPPAGHGPRAHAHAH